MQIIGTSFAIAYIVHFMLLQKKDSHEGPFKDTMRTVLFPEKWEDDVKLVEHTQHVALQDWIRRLFGAYRVKDNVWYVYEPRAELWTCPFCLSFWMTIPFTLASSLSGFDVLSVVVFHFACAFLSYFFVRTVL